MRGVRAALDRVRTPTLDRVLAAQRGWWRAGPTLVLSFDVELRADCAALPEVARLLERHALRASFACIGAWVEAYPAEHRMLVAAGHELLNHTDRHPSHSELGDARPFNSLADQELEREIGLANEKLRTIGARPRGFRSPHFGAQHTPRVYPLLRRAGLVYSSSTLAGSSPYGGAPSLFEGVWEFPVLGCPRHPALPLDSWHCTTAPDAAHRRDDDLRGVYAEALELLVRHSAFGSFYWDPRVVLQRGGYRELLGDIAGSAGIRLTTYGGVFDELDHASAD